MSDPWSVMHPDVARELQRLGATAEPIPTDAPLIVTVIHFNDKPDELLTLSRAYQQLEYVKHHQSSNHSDDDEELQFEFGFPLGHEWNDSFGILSTGSTFDCFGDFCNATSPCVDPAYREELHSGDPMIAMFEHSQGEKGIWRVRLSKFLKGQKAPRWSRRRRVPKRERSTSFSRGSPRDYSDLSE